ncbi:unnamed protein product [Amoebophrya sp. A25]|nr:unnamed protein product [Amoebophrya sp. A25]|eukprot:GSA25T00024093001.1
MSSKLIFYLLRRFATCVFLVTTVVSIAGAFFPGWQGFGSGYFTMIDYGSLRARNKYKEQYWSKVGGNATRI